VDRLTSITSIYFPSFTVLFSSVSLLLIFHRTVSWQLRSR